MRLVPRVPVCAATRLLLAGPRKLQVHEKRLSHLRSAPFSIAWLTSSTQVPPWLSTCTTNDHNQQCWLQHSSASDQALTPLPLPVARMLSPAALAVTFICHVCLARIISSIGVAIVCYAWCGTCIGSTGSNILRSCLAQWLSSDFDSIDSKILLLCLTLNQHQEHWHQLSSAMLDFASIGSNCGGM